ncbi:hypothetical protein RFN58_10760 [Streptomyces iakyrus]|uniref:hypothetical protein n=1 Tax=Streptomyces iakyrus TaxID=68219 RepID=UPI0012FEA8C2|nr:hypothetical protein [Streptomyces iakyrus]
MVTLAPSTTLRWTQVAVTRGLRRLGPPGHRVLVWRPADATQLASWDVRRAAELPGGRVDRVMRRDEEAKESTSSRWARFHAWEAKWLLALVYAMLTGV